MAEKVVVFKDVNGKILYITGNIKEITITEKVGNLSYLTATIFRDLPPFFSGDKMLNAEYVEVFDERLRKIRKFKINTIEREQEGTKFLETIEAESLNYAKYRNKHVRVVLPAGTTLTSCLQSVLFRDGFYDFRDAIKTIEEDATQGLAEQKEFIDIALLEVLDELQKIFGRYLFIDDDGKISYLKSIGKTVDVNYIYGLNYRSIKQRIDKSGVVQRIIGRGRDNLSFATVNNGKEYVETEAWTHGGDFGVFEDVEENSQHELFRKAKDELERRKKPQISYEIQTSFITKNPDMQINEIFGVGDIVNIYNPFFSPTKIQQKVLELAYNPLYPWKNPQITLGEKQTQLVEFLQNQTKEIARLKRRLTKI